MKPIPFKIVKDDRAAILRQTDAGQYFYDRLHYHPEIQITVIVKGKGLVFGGNNTRNFSPGDVLVFGQNMPHLLKNPAEYYTCTSPGVLSYSLFFAKESFGKGFFSVQEMARLNNFLDGAGRGLIYRNDEALAQKVREARSAMDERLIVCFLDVLVSLMERQGEYLNEAVYRLSLDESVGNRLNGILQYIFEHSNEKMMVEDVAKVANLSKSQFSRYFRQHTGKSFIQFLNELRIEKACRLLGETNWTVETVCYASGFQNVSNFNRQFRRVKGVAPRAWRKERAGW